MDEQERLLLIKLLDRVKDNLTGAQIQNGQCRNKELGTAIFELKTAIDKLLNEMGFHS